MCCTTRSPRASPASFNGLSFKSAFLAHQEESELLKPSFQKQKTLKTFLDIYYSEPSLTGDLALSIIRGNVCVLPSHRLLLGFAHLLNHRGLALTH